MLVCGCVLARVCVRTRRAVARGAGPDDQFIVVYNQIQQADRTPDRETAIHLYQEARQGLEQIRRGYPAWNSRVINFRLRYVDEKLSPLLAARAAACAPSSVAARWWCEQAWGVWA